MFSIKNKLFLLNFVKNYGDLVRKNSSKNLKHLSVSRGRGGEYIPDGGEIRVWQGGRESKNRPQKKIKKIKKKFALARGMY